MRRRNRCASDCICKDSVFPPNNETPKRIHNDIHQTPSDPNDREPDGPGEGVLLDGTRVEDGVNDEEMGDWDTSTEDTWEGYTV